MSWLSGIFNWITGKPKFPDIPPNIFFEKDVTSDNDFWISCILNPMLEIKYIDGIVTALLDTDKCLINGLYQYQPKTNKEISMFTNIEVNTGVRVSLYRKKGSNAAWKVASCYLSKNGPRHQAMKFNPGETVHLHLSDNEPTLEVDKSNENNEDNITVEVLGDMPKVVGFEMESTIEILFRNNSYVEDQKLLDYQTMKGNKVQLSIKNKLNVPLIIGVRSQCIFNITLQGKYLGKSTEKVEFIFKDIIYKVGINIDVNDSRIIIPTNGYYTKKNIDMQKLFELQEDPIIRGVHGSKRVQFPAVRLGNWNITDQLKKCYYLENGIFNVNLMTKVKEKIQKVYPDAFETLTYQNYKAKFHTLLFMEEIEVAIALHKYAQERINFESNGEYLVIKIPNLSEQRPSLIPNDRAIVSDPPNCSKRLGKTGRYEGIIHKVLAEELWLKFDPEFHGICGHWDYSVDFFHARNMYRKQHEVINELWKNTRLGESFLFPFRDSLEYQPPKLEIVAYDDSDYWNNLNSVNDILLPRPKVVKKIRWFNEKLNPEQKNAVINILKGEGRPMPYIIYGPPGTGKTITLTESIIQVYKEFPTSKLLVCAPTNAAVDMLLGKLISTGLFHKSVMKRLVGYNYYIGSSYNMDYDEYCVLPELENSDHVTNEPDTKLIRKHDILKLRIIVSTEGTVGLLYMMGLKKGTFTHIFIDEAGQSTEPEILLPLTFLNPQNDGQLILAGDPQQLGPVVLSILAKNAGLGQSMLTRFINYPSYQRNIDIFPDHYGYNPKVITHLIRNYRSLPEIIQIYNKLFYQSLLLPTKTADNITERKLLQSLNENTHWKVECKGPVIVHGVNGEDYQEPSNPSWFNPHEVFQVILYVTMLIKAGIPTDDIGVITPYSSQVTKIIEELKRYIPEAKLPKVGTVETFQGQEKMIIIISMVRSKSKMANNKDVKFNLGFLVAKERTNVALSRAKALVIIIGNPSTMLRNKHWSYVLSQAIASNNYLGCTVPK